MHSHERDPTGRPPPGGGSGGGACSNMRGRSPDAAVEQACEPWARRRRLSWNPVKATATRPVSSTPPIAPVGTTTSSPVTAQIDCAMMIDPVPTTGTSSSIRSALTVMALLGAGLVMTCSLMNSVPRPATSTSWFGAPVTVTGWPSAVRSAMVELPTAPASLAVQVLLMTLAVARSRPGTRITSGVPSPSAST